MHKVLYIEHVPKSVDRIIRSQIPEGLEWVALETDNQAELIEKIRTADFLLVATTPVTRDLIDKASNLKLIQHQGVGYDGTDVQAASARNIPVALAPEGTTVSVAEHTMLLILAVYRKLVTAHESMVQGDWRQYDLRPGSYNLQGKTLGLVGFGRVGREVAKRAAAFGASILYYDKYAEMPERAAGSLGAERAGFEELLSKADIVSLHVPLTDETERMMGKAAFEMMKSSAILVNTARGRLVDEAELCRALDRGQIHGAGLDVFCEEPPKPDNPLLNRENVLLTPHIAAGTEDALIEKMRAVFANMMRVVHGHRPINLVGR